MTYLRAGVAALAVLAMVACSDATPDSDATATNESDLFARSHVIWPRPASGPLELRVCWKNPGEMIQYPAPLRPGDDMAVTTTEMEGWARQSIEETWQRALAIDFVGWQRCVGGEEIPIQITDWSEGSKVVGFGAQIREMRLNLTSGDAWRFYQKRIVGQDTALAISFTVSQGCSRFDNAYSATHPEFVAMDTATFKDYYRTCLAGTIVHEFGHALGFLHEQYRRDGDVVQVQAEEQCYFEARTRWGDDVSNVATWVQPTDVPLGPFDPESIMSYCRRDWTTYHPTRSDYTFAAAIYGWR